MNCIICIDLWHENLNNHSYPEYVKEKLTNIEKLLEKTYNDSNYHIYNNNSTRTKIFNDFDLKYNFRDVGLYDPITHTFKNISADFIKNNYTNIFLIGYSLDECCMGTPLGYKYLKSSKTKIIQNCIIQHNPPSDIRIIIKNVNNLIRYENDFLQNGHMKNHLRENNKNRFGISISPVIYESINFIKSL